MKELKEEKKITTAEDLKRYSGGVVLELSPFSDSQPFVCRLKRPELLQVVREDVPNELLSVAYDLFNPGKKENENNNRTAEQIFNENAETREVLECIAKATMVEPTFNDVEGSGMKMTMLQLLDIYNYVNTGVENLKFFREDKKN